MKPSDIKNKEELELLDKFALQVFNMLMAANPSIEAMGDDCKWAGWMPFARTPIDYRWRRAYLEAAVMIQEREKYKNQ